jgi:ribonuclease E
MSETEISQTPEGRPPEGRPSESRPPESDLPGAPSTSAPNPVAAPGVARLAEEPAGGSRKPKIGDTRPARVAPPPPKPAPAPVVPLARPEATAPVEAEIDVAGPAGPDGDDAEEGRRSRSRRRTGRDRDRRSKQVGRYLVCVHVQPHMTQIAMLEGRTLVEHYVSRAADDTNQIDGNVYRGRVQNVLPGMEAAFVDIGIPKNAVLYRGDVRYDKDDIEGGTSQQPRIEDVLKAGQVILCQVTKNPIGAKGARLTQEVSLPGRFAVLVPNSSAFGISKRLGDTERRRLRRIIDEVKPTGHGMIVRTAAEGVSADELQRDVTTLLEQWNVIEAKAKTADQPGLLYREPELAVRILREELNSEYRGVVIDDRALFEQVRDYVMAVSPELADRVEYYDAAAEGLPIFERHHVHEQLHKALDRKVWLPSGGSLIIERTEALTVIDVNTGKNVGKTNLEETVYRNNLEAAEEVARQLRLRDIGGIIVIDFIDMEVRENRDKVAAALRNALARDKTRTQVFDISELGLVEMTRKRVSEGLLETLSTECTVCGGRGVTLDDSVLR